MTKKVVFCIPTMTKPYQVTLDALAASVPLIQAAGWDDHMVSEVGCPYVSHARATMLRKALSADADVIVFIDHDVSWDPQDLLTLIETAGDVVAGTYRFKNDTGEYMGAIISNPDGYPMVRESDGALFAHSVPAGFLKITRAAVNQFMRAYPELVYGEPCNPSIDLFNHGAHKGVWYGEDYAFSRNWRDCGGAIALVPNLNISHHASDGTVYEGNFHLYLGRQVGGALYEGNDNAE